MYCQRVIMNFFETSPQIAAHFRNWANNQHPLAFASGRQALLEKWPDYHGTAIYGAVARLNHACNPNCRVEFNGSADCRVIACRNVPEG